MPSFLRDTSAPTPPGARFQVLEELGSGAMGVVHRVHDMELGRDLARKTLLDLTPDEIYHLKREFRAAAGIVHPNLNRLHELFVDESGCFFTMDLVDGLHLDEHVRGTAARRASGVRPSALAQRSEDQLPGTFRPDRFVEALRQVVSGVAALHAAGLVHRDLKPSNVLVTADGKAIVLDFGLAVPWRPGERPSNREDDVAGTLPYMAPEQLYSGVAEPASDWYGVGAMMFELLTGELPCSGSLQDIYREKGRPLRAASLAKVDPAYQPLIARLLSPKPEERPGAEAILEALGGGAPHRASTTGNVPFVGREREMAELRAALDEVRSAGKLGIVRVQGLSGIGKSELLRRFLSLETSGARTALGRSHPQESVPYKVFDGAMDALSQKLVEIPEEQRKALWPEHLGPLLRLFPVLRRAVSGGTEGEALSADPREERRFAFVALRELLKRIAGDMPLVLALDDVQWGDLDSAALLGSLATPPLEAPVLVILAHRSEDTKRSAFLRALEELNPSSLRRTVEVGALSEADAAALTEELLRGLGRGARLDPAALLRESAGSPFFIGELARNVAEAGEGESPTEVLDIVGARLDRLSEVERRLLETVAAAGRAIEIPSVLRAADCPGASRLDLLRLSDLRWLRQTDLERAPAVEAYHDRLRERVIERLASTPERRRSTHARLASTFDKPGADPEILLFHYDAAGDTKSAGRSAVAAAERANQSLAFGRAAELYARAVELRPESHSLSKLHGHRAEALTNAGRALEAARAFEQAAALTDGPEAGERKIDLLRRAGEHYLRTAHYDQGLAIMGDVLRSVGAELPRSHRAAMLPAIGKRLRFLVRGIEFTPREPHEVAADVQRRLDALWSTAISLALLDYQRADPIALTHLLESLERGDTGRALRALAYESSVLAGVGGKFLRGKSAQIEKRVSALAETRGIPYELAWARLAIGSNAWFGGRWRECVEHCDIGASIFREQCRGVSWEIATMEMFSLSALGIMGDIAELQRRLPLAIQTAEERGDLFGLNNSRLGQPSILWLAQGKVSELRDLADKADRSMWKGGYHTHRYHHAFAVCQADLHDGDPWSCLDRLEEHWPAMQAARILYLEWPQIELRHLRARASLLAARLLRDGAPVPHRHRRLRYGSLTRFIEAEAKAIARHDIPPAAALAGTLRLGLATLSDARDQAEQHRAALRACRDADMLLLAELLGDPRAGTPELRRALGVGM